MLVAGAREAGRAGLRAAKQDVTIHRVDTDESVRESRDNTSRNLSECPPTVHRADRAVGVVCIAGTCEMLSERGCGYRGVNGDADRIVGDPQELVVEAAASRSAVSRCAVAQAGSVRVDDLIVYELERTDSQLVVVEVVGGLVEPRVAGLYGDAHVRDACLTSKAPDA